MQEAIYDIHGDLKEIGMLPEIFVPITNLHINFPVSISTVKRSGPRYTLKHNIQATKKHFQNKQYALNLTRSCHNAVIDK